MQSFDLTPAHRIVPDLSVWQNSVRQLAISEQDSMNVESLRNLEDHYQVNVRLDSINVEKTTWPSDLMRQINHASYPLNKLLARATNLSPDWLAYWEVYVAVVPSLAIDKTKTQRKTATRALRSFHVCDNKMYTINPLQKAINRLEYDTSVQITWSWLATNNEQATEADRVEFAKNRDRWLHGVDGLDEISVANMRAWKNKITTTLKAPDLIVVNNTNEDDNVNGIAFALINLKAGGAVIIYVPRVASTSTVAMIHLFAQCFTKTVCIHTQAADRMFLCGTGFLDVLTTKHVRLLYAYIALDPGTTNQSPFTLEYMREDSFVDCVDALFRMNSVIQSWRYELYEKVLKINAYLIKSASSRTFDGYLAKYLADNYEDSSDEWRKATGCNFV